jgi:hypothetical protein
MKNIKNNYNNIHAVPRLPRHPPGQAAGQQDLGAIDLCPVGVPEPPRGVLIQQRPGNSTSFCSTFWNVSLRFLPLNGDGTERHLVDEHAERPLVDGEAVVLAAHHLWRDVLCADQEEYSPVDRTDAFAYELAL